VTAFLVAFALFAQPSVRPWPIGPGPRYTPPGAPAAVIAGKPLGALRCGSPGSAFLVHVELFVDRRVVVLPAGIGVAAPLARSGAIVTPRGCVYPLRTLAPDGVVEVARGSALTVGDLFRIWGEPLLTRGLGSFRSSSPVHAYVDGNPVRASAGAIVLTPHAQIVLELGAYLAPHPFFLFPGGKS
jgi:hypothetical protein